MIERGGLYKKFFAEGEAWSSTQGVIQEQYLGVGRHEPGEPNAL